MSIAPIAAAAAKAFVPPAAGAAGAASSSAFADGLQAVSKLTGTADQLAGQVATGTLQDVHDFTAAAARSQLGVELTVALRNRAVESYQEIMRMQL